MQPTTKAEEYRREAEKAEKHAEAATGEAERNFYSALGKRWRDMAEHAEKIGR